jgi:hypothetical protein
VCAEELLPKRHAEAEKKLAFVKVISNVQVSQALKELRLAMSRRKRRGNLTSCKPVSFSRRTLLHGVSK